MVALAPVNVLSNQEISNRIAKAQTAFDSTSIMDRLSTSKKTMDAAGQTAKTGILGKLKGLAGKVWGLAKAHPKTAIAIGAIAGVLGISKIAKKSQEKKAENLSINA
ncbi:hypothetical protein IKA92_00400 [bacterium]|nr:hypothetical protein [bacterium]